jgi:2-polyprenyl-6-hydroxyphenyl methylase/3-demethylubiquinone-9 3-methyltransferase
MQHGTVNLEEISKFGRLAKNWWNEHLNEAKMLHKMNPLRLEYILNQTTIAAKKVLEVGCGGGILSLPLARLEANLTSIEPSLELFEVAKNKAKEENLNINFINTALENLTEDNFDIILIMDVIEHVNNADTFLKEAQKRLKNGGLIIISTINKTLLSKVFVKFIAEGVGLIPRDTHSADKFISPQTIETSLNECKKTHISGFFYNPLLQKFSLTKNTQMNYFLTLSK